MLKFSNIYLDDSSSVNDHGNTVTYTETEMTRCDDCSDEQTYEFSHVGSEEQAKVLEPKQTGPL